MNPVIENGEQTRLSAEDVTGFWEIAASAPAAGEGVSCLVSLNRFPQTGGYGVLVEKCSLPGLADTTGWRLTPGGFELYDRRGSSLMQFRRVDVDTFQTLDAGYRMKRTPLS